MSGPSLEDLIESEEIGLELFHPGGLEITAELGRVCRIWKNNSVLDVGSGTGESALFLTTAFSCRVTGLDISDAMVAKATEKSRQGGVPVDFVRGDAHELPFAEGTFDAVISECTVSLLSKERAVAEMVRVAKPDGHVGIHDIYWRKETPQRIRQRLGEIGNESPETLQDWKSLFERCGLVDVVTVDKADLMQRWSHEIEKKIGPSGRLRMLFRILGRWGLRGLRTIRESERIFRSEYMGYGIIAGRKPEVPST
jgi:SAM-dependent methyltransferase